MYLQQYYVWLRLAACCWRPGIRPVLGVREWFVFVDSMLCFTDLFAQKQLDTPNGTHLALSLINHSSRSIFKIWCLTSFYWAAWQALKQRVNGLHKSRTDVGVESNNSAKFRVLFVLVAQPLKDVISLLCQPVINIVITPWPVHHCVFL